MPKSVPNAPHRDSVRKCKPIVAIDGPAGSGKSTVARFVAKALNVPYIDTGAMYRAVTLKALRENIPFTNIRRLKTAAAKARIELLSDPKGGQRVLMDGKDVTRDIRTPELTNKVFYVAQVPSVRHEMVKKQRSFGRRTGAVMEGRDIGTVVFPKADHKFFLDANPQVRAARRHKELLEAGKKADREDVLKDLLKRDRHDRERKQGPLRRAEDAALIDTTALTIRQVVDRILSFIRPNPPVNGGQLVMPFLSIRAHSVRRGGRVRR